MSFKCITPAILLLPFIAMACSSEATVAPPPPKLRVLATFLPMWVFAANVAGDVPEVSVELLLAAETGCPHDYSLSHRERTKIELADILIANGVIEPFLDRLAIDSPGLKILNTIDYTSKKLFEDEDHDDHRHTHDAPNPHTWVSPTNAIMHVEAIRDTLIKELPSHTAVFQRNADRYIGELRKIETDVIELAGILTKRKAITVHNAFAYIFADLKIEVVAMIGQPTTPQSIVAIESLVREDGAVIFGEPQFPENTFRMIVSDLNVTPYKLDPIASGEQSPTLYERTMRTNLETLRAAMVQP